MPEQPYDDTKRLGKTARHVSEIMRNETRLGCSHFKNVPSNLSSLDPTVFERYRGALRRYVAAADSLEGLTGPEFEEAYRRVEEARTIFEQLRAQLAQQQRR
jgi:hypothetical protein